MEHDILLLINDIKGNNTTMYFISYIYIFLIKEAKTFKLTLLIPEQSLRQNAAAALTPTSFWNY